MFQMRQKMGMFRKIRNVVQQKFMERCRSLAIKSSDRRFCNIFNFLCRARGLKVRCNLSQGKIMATEDQTRVFFVEKYQNWNSYINGFDARVRGMEKRYHLSRIPLERGDLIVDCGANVGDLNLYFQQRNIEIRYVGFEPSPKEFDCLTLNTVGHTALSYALADTDQEVEFFLSEANADSSIFRPEESCDSIIVQGRTLDSFHFGPIKLLKLEAEGAELEVLKGAKDSLSKIDWISADCGFEKGIEKESTIVPVTNFLLRNGFELLSVSPKFCALFRRLAS